MQTALFQKFKSDISSIAVPSNFTFPFYYEPHPLSTIAVEALENYLENQSDFIHNFGLNETQEGLVIGKMFGVLVCQDAAGNLGYLWAFSGKLAEQNQLPNFVPTVFDMLEKDGFFKKEEVQLNALNIEIQQLECSEAYKILLSEYKEMQQKAQTELQKQKDTIKQLKQERDLIREANKNESEARKAQLELDLSESSKNESILLKKMTKYWRLHLEKKQESVLQWEQKISDLKNIRRQKSAQLQQQLFAQYAFVNQQGEWKSIGELFDNNPPAGAGECAAPKLLHYAFQNQLKPICMAEFWWGQSPKSEIRKHKHYYPACKSKCEPILMQHLLKGLSLDDNPFEANPAAKKELEMVYEDAFLAVVHKPEELLSVPGKRIIDSVYSRLKMQFPEATGPLLVHRLDMSTSGLLLMAKTEAIHKALQSQFILRTIKKRYVALLDGLIEEEKGMINLPLRVDLEDRPRQLVCFEHGKSAQTYFEVIERREGQTKVYFYPITGRTHQLRVHAAHELGLKTPILGDDLYGKKAARLYLHAEQLQFQHPITKKEMKITKNADF